MEQRGIRLDTHNIRYRHSDAECIENSLYHNKSCSANSIIESGVAEEDSSEQTVNYSSNSGTSCTHTENGA